MRSATRMSERTNSVLGRLRRAGRGRTAQLLIVFAVSAILITTGVADLARGDLGHHNYLFQFIPAPFAILAGASVPVFYFFFARKEARKDKTRRRNR